MIRNWKTKLFKTLQVRVTYRAPTKRAALWSDKNVGGSNKGNPKVQYKTKRIKRKHVKTGKCKNELFKTLNARVKYKCLPEPRHCWRIGTRETGINWIRNFMNKHFDLHLPVLVNLQNKVKYILLNDMGRQCLQVRATVVDFQKVKETDINLSLTDDVIILCTPLLHK